MKYAGRLNSWAWREHVKILKKKQQINHDKMIRKQEAHDYLEELKRKL
jgi:hypothetical protein|tara:strand:+ start:101 stop:244 length:144 start_codon:yes stop_codon:yes gene_type:complete